MPKLVTRRTLIDRARRISRRRGDPSIGVGEWPDIINAAIAEVWGRLSAASDNYGTEKHVIVGVQGQTAYPLPEDFMTLTSLIRPTGTAQGRNALVTPIDEAAYLVRYDVTEPPRPGHYWLTRAGIELRPAPATGEAITMVYVTTPPVLEQDTDTFDCVHEIDQALVHLAAAEAASNQQDAQLYAGRAAGIIDRAIVRFAGRRGGGGLTFGSFRR